MQRVYLVDDWLETAPRERQWRPDAPRNTGGGFDGLESNYWDAQSRQLDFMRQHPNVSSVRSFGSATMATKWILLADDDTFIQVDVLLDFLAGHDPQVPALFGYMLSDAHVLGYDYPCGGAGMLLSAAAYDVLASRLLGPECPLLAFNDLTIGFCAHSRGVPLVHHPGMHCAPDVNRAMRPGENLLDIQKSVAVHRLIGFQSFLDMINTLEVLKGQLHALLQRRCLLAARSPQGEEETETDPLDSRRFFWSVEALADAVSACRAFAPKASQDGKIHLEFLLFQHGLPVARYHEDRHVPLTAKPASRSKRWPEWLEQLRHLRCAREPQPEGGDEAFGDSEVTWRASWTAAAPRLGELQVQATGASVFAASALVDSEAVESSFEALKATGGSWLEELKRAARPFLSGRTPGPGRRWLFVDFSPSSTFLNLFESLRVLRSVSGLFFGSSDSSPYLQDVRGPVDLSADAPPPLAMAYEYFDLNVEQAAGLWLNGVAAQRLLRCQPLKHPIGLDAEAHANDWPTQEERLSLMWHNAVAVDVFRSVATAMSIGNVASREQMRALSQLVQRRACAAQRRSRGSDRPGKPRRSWMPRSRILGGDLDVNLTAEAWRLPGARFLGQSLVAFRSEHFLPDAQAAGLGATPSTKPSL
ncbi:unnamed protein product [Symbiodinium sp. KB8]|nr:unnamed protein product [Symbiodinium sp. KB8]